MKILENLRELRQERRAAAVARREAKRHVEPQRQMLTALNSPRPSMQGNPTVYAGTVSWEKKVARRRKGKAAKAARKINRGR